MRGLFCGTSAKTNEEYRKILEKRNRYFIALILLGVVTLGILGGGEALGELNLTEHMTGFYSGVGTGLIIAGVVLTIKNSIMMYLMFFVCGFLYPDAVPILARILFLCILAFFLCFAGLSRYYEKRM